MDAADLCIGLFLLAGVLVDDICIFLCKLRSICYNFIYHDFPFRWSNESRPSISWKFSGTPPASRISFAVGFFMHESSSLLTSSFPAILHTIFFHRYFPSIKPSYCEVLDFTLPLVADPELETLIDTRVGQLIRQLSSTSSPKSSVRGKLFVQFFEKKRRKIGAGLGWFTGGKGEEEVCWERWSLEVTLATPKTEIGRSFDLHKDQINIVLTYVRAYQSY